MEISLVDLGAQYDAIKGDVDDAIQRVLDHRRFILGEEVEVFEGAFADYVGARGAVGVASGTAALHLALRACEIGPGDQVITTAHTFIATAEAILHAGARPVFVDIDQQTYNLDSDQVADAITSQTRAILPVHLYGQPCDMAALVEIAQRYGLSLIEDAAQAHGAEYRGQRCGSIGDLACFSFYPGKNLGAYGDAGMVTGNDEKLLERVRRLRDHGRTSKHEHYELGFGERLDALQAAVLNVKLQHLEEWTEARRAHAGRYAELLAGTELVVPLELEERRHVYHLYVVRTPFRDDLLDHLRRRGIRAGVHYPIPVHRQPAFQKLGYGDATLPITECAAEEVLSLPMYPELTAEALNYVAGTIREWFARH